MRISQFRCLTVLIFGALGLVGQQALAEPSYVGSAACADCHQAEAAAWEGSHHALAWTEPTEENVLGDFGGTSFEHDGMRSDFRETEDGYAVRVTENDGVTTDYPVHSVVGIAPLQQYLLETEPGRLQSFDVVWDVENTAWYHLYPDQHLPPGDGLHWSGPYKTWNARCAECHATGYQRNFGPRTQSYRSTVAEIGVGCESCHGPGSDHIVWANEGGAGDDLGLTMVFSGQDRDGYVDQCAGCHSRRGALEDGNPMPGAAFYDSYTLALLRPGLYHADGQILDEVYVYGSFLQSKMYDKGVGCGHCHDPHSATLLAEGNALCAQCHSPAGNPDFPSLTLAEYDTPDHHFHDVGSDAAQCKSCHMIERVYMGIDGRRDHSFRVPRPDVGAKIGAPDACTDCHSDQSQEWAAAEIAARFPQGRAGRTHYGQTLHAGRQDPLAAGEALLELALDVAQPGIVRATAASLLHNVPLTDLPNRSLSLLDDPDPLVRAASARLQAGAERQARVERLMPLLADPMKSVRIEAARSMLDLSPQGLRPSQIALLRSAMGDWQRSLSNKLDFPETHLTLAGLALTQRNTDAASAAFREVVRLDPQRSDAWVMLVRIAAAANGPKEARAVLNEALEILPRDPVLTDLDRQLPQ